MLTAEQMADIGLSIDQDLVDAVAFADASPYPAPEEALEDVFAGSQWGGGSLALSMSFAAALEYGDGRGDAARPARLHDVDLAVAGRCWRSSARLRVKRMPISEATMTGIAVGSAGCGFRPVVHWRSVTFAFMAFDQVVNQACKIRYMFGGQRDFPIVFRASYVNGIALGRPALADRVRAVRPPGRAQGRPAVRRRRRARPAQERHPRQQPGRLLRAEPDRPDRGGGAGRRRAWCRSAWRRSSGRAPT